MEQIKPMTDEFIFSAVPADKVGECWDHARFYLKAAAERSNLATLLEIRQRLDDGIAMLILVSTKTKVVGAATLEVYDVGAESVLNIAQLGGDDFERWADRFNDWLTYVAKEQGCTSVQMIGRKGWMRKLNKLGFKTLYVSMGREV